MLGTGKCCAQGHSEGQGRASFKARQSGFRAPLPAEDRSGVREAERGSDSWAPTPVGRHGWSVSGHHSALPIGDFDWLLATLLKRSSLKSRLRNSPEKNRSEIFISPLSQHSCRLSQGVFHRKLQSQETKAPYAYGCRRRGQAALLPWA